MPGAVIICFPPSELSPTKFSTPESHIFTFFVRVRRFGSKSSSRSHKMVSNDPILDSKVLTDELGQLGRPARRWSLTSLAGSPGRPGRLAPAWRAGVLLPGKGTREELRRGRSAQAMMEPPHAYHRRWLI